MPTSSLSCFGSTTKPSRRTPAPPMHPAHPALDGETQSCRTSSTQPASSSIRRALDSFNHRRRTSVLCTSSRSKRTSGGRYTALADVEEEEEEKEMLVVVRRVDVKTGSVVGVGEKGAQWEEKEVRYLAGRIVLFPYW